MFQVDEYSGVSRAVQGPGGAKRPTGIPDRIDPHVGICLTHGSRDLYILVPFYYTIYKPNIQQTR